MKKCDLLALIEACQDKLNSLLTEKETIEKRLSKIIDMELDDDIIIHMNKVRKELTKMFMFNDN